MSRFYLLIAASIVAVGALFWTQRGGGEALVSGVIEAQDIRVGSRVGGRTQVVHVVEGQPIRRGEALVSLEPYDLNERLAEAEAALSAASARSAQLQAGYRSEEIAQARAARDRFAAVVERLVAGPRPLEINVLRERLAMAEAELPKAESDFSKAESLLAQGSGSDQEVMDRQRVRDVARRRVAAARDELSLALEGTRAEDLAEARAQLAGADAALRLLESGYRSEEKAEAEAQVEAARSRVGAIRRQIEELKIVSPIDGYVEAIELRPGDLVGAGAPVATLIDPGELWVRAYIPERYVGLQRGAKLEVRVTALAGRRFEGEVAYVSREAEFTPSSTQTPEERAKQVFRIKVTIQDGHELLRAGMTADVVLPP